MSELATNSNYRIGWIGDGNFVVQTPDTHVVSVRHDEQDRLDVDLVVIDSRVFNTIDEYRQFCHQLTCPILHIVDGSDLAEVVEGIPEKDDVCLATAPSEIVSIRIRKLRQLVAGAADPLTELPDRTRLVSLTSRFAGQASEDRPTSVILFDLDHFKAINDRYGHQAGDDVLRRVGQLLNDACRQGAFPARYGGEEFGILMLAAESEALDFAESIRTQIAEADFAEGISVTVSLGVATSRQPTDPQSLFAQADEALFAAKANGRNLSLHHTQLRDELLREGEDISVMGLEHRARVLTERVTKYIAQRSRKILQELREESQTDGLTGFHTRRFLDRRLQAEFGASVEAMPLTVALLDIDYFGEINKTHGWPTGDKILREVCDRIRAQVRDLDWVGRYGGEEFCIVMPETDVPQASTVLQRLRIAVAEQPFESTRGQPIHVTISIGAVQRRATDANAAEILERASRQTLTAKREGRNRLCVVK